MEHFYCLHDPPCDILRHAEAHVGQSAKQRTRPLGNHFPMQHMLQRPALPWAVQRDIHLFAARAHRRAVHQHGDGIAGVAAGGGAVDVDLIHHAGEALVVQCAGGDLHLLAHLDLADVLLIHVHVKGELGAVIDDGRVGDGSAGIGQTADVVAHIQVLLDHLAVDGGGNGVVVQFLLGIFQGELGGLQGDAGVFDPDYDGYPNADGKLLTVQNLGNGKALAYARNDAAGTAIDSYSHYYSIIDLATGERTRLVFGGKELSYSGGRFSQRSVVFNEKAYIGVNTEADANAIIYIYDTKTGTVEKGAEVAGEFYFDMIRVVEND